MKALNFFALSSAVILSISAHGMTKKKRPVVEPTPTPVVSVTPTPTVTVSPEPQPGVLFTIKSATNYSVKDRARLDTAVDYAGQIVLSKCFEDFMVARSLVWTLGLTRKQVVEKLRAKPYAFQLNLYYENTKVAGWTKPAPYQIINQNSKFFYGAHPVDIASNLVHEYSHKVGFDHASAKSYYSVPYSSNAAVEGCGEQLGLYNSGNKVLMKIKKMK